MKLAERLKGREKLGVVLGKEGGRRQRVKSNNLAYGVVQKKEEGDSRKGKEEGLSDQAAQLFKKAEGKWSDTL